MAERRQKLTREQSMRAKKSLRAAGGVTVPKQSMDPVVRKKNYSENGRVVDNARNEQILVRAMKAKRARRAEVIGMSVHSYRSKNEGQSRRIPRIDKTPETMRLIRTALDNNILFNDWTPEQIEHVIYAMKPKKVNKGVEVIKEGDEGFNFFVVNKGKFQFSKNDKIIGEANGGDSFGELALLYFAPRASTVTAMVNSELWRLDKHTFRQILDSSIEIKEKRMTQAIKRCKLFEDFSDERVKALTKQAHYQCFRKGDVIISKNDIGTIFYVIVAGKVQVTKAGEELFDTVFSSGDYFGERSLMTNEPRNANVIAISDTDLVAIDKPTFEKFLGKKLKLLDKNLGLRVLKSIELLHYLDDDMFLELCESLETEVAKKGKKIIQQGDEGKKFYIIKNGEVEISRTKEDGSEDQIATLKTGGHFGEMALLDEEPRSANATALVDSELFTLDRKKFETLFGPLKELAESRRARKRMLDGDREEVFRFEDLERLIVLGTGTFGVVWLTQNRKNKQTYALKCLQKQQIAQFKQQKNVVNEKNILMQSRHPFILCLHATFQDKNKLYMLLELVQGGELFNLLHSREDHKLPNQQAMFYTACVADAIHYLHERSIIYRDLKPENILIDNNGYAKMVDFGFAKKVNGKTYTLCGTPEYLAPELVLQKGHNRAVDLWAIGILVFEMLVGQSPFADPRNEQINICRNIVRGRVTYPGAMSKSPKHFVSSLLKRYPHERLGMRDLNAIRSHDWFHLDFKDLRGKKLPAPWVPEITSNIDASNFDEFDEDDIEDLEFTGDQKDWEGVF